MDRAVEQFGTTTDFEEAGFILPSGEMLKFTDDKHRGERQYDRRAIGLVYGVDVGLNVNYGFNEKSSTLPDGMYYEVTYNGDKNECCLDAYKKLENQCMKF